MCELYEKHCKQAFANISEQLGRIDESLRGNGKPGLNARVDSLEKSRNAEDKSRSKFLWMITGSIVTMASGYLWQKFIG
ncbi:MAG: hypothetical protein JXD22_11685 [Sedimentisphaerales bacterium]|nr:hypothetical protein [Sedimentisphaerales bacterium]